MTVNPEMKDCPNCPNQGWIADENMYTGEPEQIQCEFCYTEPNSTFNVLAANSAELSCLNTIVDNAKSDADRIALWLCLNFYPDNYVNFELSNTVGGVLSQIDNMVAGLKQ